MPVQAEELQPLAVQVEAVGPEGGLAEADLPGQDVAAEAGNVSVAWTVYSFGLSGDHRLTGPSSVRLSFAVLVPGEVTLTVADLRGDLRAAVEQLHEQGAGAVRASRAESMVHSTSTWRCGLSTSAGSANRSERKTCGTTRRLTSR